MSADIINLNATRYGKFNQWSVSSFLIRLLGNVIVISIIMQHAAAPADGNVAAVSHAQYVPTLTAAAAYA